MLPNRKPLALGLTTVPYLIVLMEIIVHVPALSTNLRRSTCTNEIESANKTISGWSATMKQMVSESDLSGSSSESVVREQTKIRNLIENFSANMNKRPIERLVKDLESIRRASNRLALDIYLRTFDMRWPQTSVQLGVAVERVQQACLPNLDRAAMLVLNSPFSPLTKSLVGK